MNMLKQTFVTGLIAFGAVTAYAAATPDEIKRLGSTLTLVGAEKLGNADKSIPEYTGGMTTFPAGFQKDPNAHPNAFPKEKPLFSITSKNLAQYESKLSAATKELLTKYSSYRVDVYPTHRTAALPTLVQENTVMNAATAKTNNDGLGVANALPGIPFPIPHTGNEAMWNHLLSYRGQAIKTKYDAITVDAAGKATLVTTGELTLEYPIYDPKRTTPVSDSDVYFKLKVNYVEPARRSGEAQMLVDAVNPIANPRKAWQYLPGQRRVKLAPDLAYDTPNPGASGQGTFDDIFIFTGAMDRYDFKLVGKKELYIPYNTFKISYMQKSDNVLLPNHRNPDFERWELHRVWVVEATLKPGKRHIYPRRVFYLDEDTWLAVASDEYDARGQLFRAGFSDVCPNFEVGSAMIMGSLMYDFIVGGYNMQGANMGSYIGFKKVAPLPANEWSPEALAGSGLR